MLKALAPLQACPRQLLILISCFSNMLSMCSAIFFSVALTDYDLNLRLFLPQLPSSLYSARILNTPRLFLCLHADPLSHGQSQHSIHDPSKFHRYVLIQIN